MPLFDAVLDYGGRFYRNRDGFNAELARKRVKFTSVDFPFVYRIRRLSLRNVGIVPSLSPLLELAPLWHRRRLNDVNGTRPACRSLTRTIDRPTLERTRECRDFIWPDGTRSFAEFVSRMDRVFAAEFEVAGSRFVGRSFNVGGISPRHASISVHSRDRDVSCVDFVSIIHPDYRPEPIRAAVVHGARLLSSRDLRLGEEGTTGGIWPTIAARHSPIFGTDRSHRIPDFRDFARSETHSRLYRLSITIRLLTDGNDYFLFVFEVIFKSVAHKRRDKNKRQFFLEKLIY